MASSFGPASLVAILCALILAPSAGAGYYPMREDVDDEHYVVGALSRSGESGTISWKGAAAEEAGGGGNAPEGNTFLSAPLPYRLYVNVSRYVKLDVWLVGEHVCEGANSAKTRLGAVVYIGDRIVAGVPPNNGRFPILEDGDTLCRLRMQVEHGVWEAGSVLRLVILHSPTDTVFPEFRFGGAKATTLRIPYFADEEVVYRYPVYEHGSASGGANGVADVAGFLGLAAVAIAVPRASARQRRTLLLAALVSSVAVAGCAVPSEPAKPASATDVDQEDLVPAYQEGNLSAKGLGTIIGQVERADVKSPVEGAVVSLLGSPQSARTDGYGRFTFRDVKVGSHVLLVTKEGFAVLEGTIKVLPDLITRVNITLRLLESSSAADRPHHHDYWGEELNRTLAKDADLGFTCSAAFVVVAQPCRPVRQFRVPLPVKDKYQSILPGTYRVEVVLDWDTARVGLGKVALAFRANNDPNPANWTPLVDRAPKEPFSIASAWDMTDPGHQRHSSWVFNVHYEPPSTSDTLENQRRNDANRTSAPTFKATIRIFKGVVPLEPQHQDFWHGNQTVVVQPTKRMMAGFTDQKLDGYEWHPWMATGWWSTAWVPMALVPPETTWLEIYLNASRDKLPAYPVEFRYKTTETGPPAQECWNSWEFPTASAAEYCNGPAYRHVIVPSTATKNVRIKLPITPHDADPFYGTRTLWVFGLSPQRDPDYLPHVQVDRRAGTMYHDLTVMAHRDEAPKTVEIT